MTERIHIRQRYRDEFEQLYLGNAADRVRGSSRKIIEVRPTI